MLVVLILCNSIQHKMVNIEFYFIHILSSHLQLLNIIAVQYAVSPDHIDTPSEHDTQKNFIQCVAGKQACLVIYKTW